MLSIRNQIKLTPIFAILILFFISIACDDRQTFEPFEPIFVVAAGQIVDEQENPLPNVMVNFYHVGRYLNQYPLYSAVTDADGIWSTTVEAGLTYLLAFSKTGLDDLLISHFFSEFAFNDTVRVPEPMGVLEYPKVEFDKLYRIVLIWESSPRDLDAHLTGPKGDGSRFHVNWNNRAAVSIDGDTLAKLDVDRRNGYGPEIVSIHKLLPDTARYRYSVHNYSADGITETEALYHSNATVRIFDASGMKQEFKIGNNETPPDSIGNTWRVFEIDSHTGEIIPVNQILDGVSYGEIEFFKKGD